MCFRVGGGGSIRNKVYPGGWIEHMIRDKKLQVALVAFITFLERSCFAFKESKENSLSCTNVKDSHFFSIGVVFKINQ